MSWVCGEVADGVTICGLPLKGIAHTVPGRWLIAKYAGRGGGWILFVRSFGRLACWKHPRVYRSLKEAKERN